MSEFLWLQLNSEKYPHAVLSVEDRSLLSGICRATIRERDPSLTCTRSSAHRSPGGLIISDRPSSGITRHHSGQAQACQQESSIFQQPCWAAAGPAPANRNVVCLQNASIGPALACRRGKDLKIVLKDSLRPTPRTSITAYSAGHCIFR